MEAKITTLEETVTAREYTIQEYEKYGPPLVEGGGEGYRTAEKDHVGHEKKRFG